MTDKMDYKKIRTDIINGKKRCIYMKPKGKREYVKSGGEFVSLSAYIKTLQKKNKKKGGGDGEDSTTEQLPKGWVMKESKTYPGRHYYANDKGESTWINPSRVASGIDAPDTSPASSPRRASQSNNTREPYKAYNEINKMALAYVPK
jgi:hypothetical protein